MCCLQLPHYIALFLRCYRQLPHHISIIYPCAVANNHITSPHIIHVLLPINTSHCVLFPSCYHQLLHHIDIISYIMQSITPSHCHLLPMCCRQLPHTTLRPISQVLPPITISHRNHFPDDVVNNPITSPPTTQNMSPITTSDCVLLPRCCRQLPYHSASYLPGAVTKYYITST